MADCRGSHVWQMVGRAGRLGRGDCVDPLWVVCLRCCADMVLPCGTSKISRCRPCALRYKRKVQRRCADGLALVPEGAALFLTWTPPGSKVQCRKHRYCVGGRDGCELYQTVTSPVEAAVWHRSLVERRNRFLTALRRGEGSLKVGGRLVPIPDLEYFEAREVQDKRAAESGLVLLHGHMVLRRRSGASLALSERKVRELAIKFGFGRKIDLKVVAGSGLSRYVTKTLALYVSKGVCDRDRVQVLDDSGSLAVWSGRLWVSSRAWGPGSSRRAVAGIAEGEPLVSFNEPLCGESASQSALGAVLGAFPGSKVVDPSSG